MTKQTVPYQYLDTPVCLLDLNKLETNIKLIQQAANEAGVKLRPHTKVHESAYIAKMQLEAGASGIEVGAINQAEPMAEAGISDIFIVHPFFGEHKLETLKRLLSRWPKFKFTIVVDMVEQAEGISKVAQAIGKTVPLVIKLDTGVDRYGVAPGEPTLNLAKKLQQVPGIELIGLYAHESGAKPTEENIAEMAYDVASKTCEMARMLKKEGFKMEHVSVGASSTHFSTCRYIKEGKFSEITELHPGQRVIGDVRCMMGLGITKEQCALTVLVSIMSTTHPNYVVIDAGWKTFSSESMIERRETPGFFWNGKPTYGSIQRRSDIRFARIAAETGWIYYMEGAKKDLKVGDRLEIVPNNVSSVINTHDKIYGVRNIDVEVVIPITGRCLGS
ncbi:MAG TPA: hypothetical protein ENO17_02950 [Candidatus Atribacteria bacterium]|nr:hypothetical protein [Candidatus Atribacteria bacterium]